MNWQNIANGMGWNEEYQEDKTSKTELEPADADCYLAERKAGLEFLCLLHGHSMSQDFRPGILSTVHTCWCMREDFDP